jgi:ribosomal protein S12
MATALQSTKRKRLFRKTSLKYKNPTLSRTPILKKCPQAKGIVTKVTTMSPKKT